MKSFRFSIEMAVRDYECDFQGIVNNSVYLNYLEHTRHEFAKSLGLDVVTLAEQGINVVVVRAEIDYRASLRGGDLFMVGVNVERVSRLRFAFNQEIYRLSGETNRRDAPHASDAEPGGKINDASQQLILRARMIATAVNDQGRPILTKGLDGLFIEEEMKQY